MWNVAGVGATAALVGMDLDPIEDVLGDVMSERVLRERSLDLPVPHR
jgi:hypothetical protein